MTVKWSKTAISLLSVGMFSALLEIGQNYYMVMYSVYSPSLVFQSTNVYSTLGAVLALMRYIH